MRRQSARSLFIAFLGLFVSAGAALAGDVGGNVHSSPGTITLRLEWGSSFENSKEISKTGDGATSST